MKCIQCDTDNNLQDRTEHEGRCKNCGHPFVFDPQARETMFSNLGYWATSRFTDVLFKNAINAISAEDSLYFTPQQFLYLLDKRLTIKGLKYGQQDIVGCLIMLMCILVLASGVIGMIMLIVYSFSRLGAIIDPKKIPPDRKNRIRHLQVVAGVIIICGIYISLGLSSITVAEFSVFIFSIAWGLGLIYFGQRQLDRLFFVPQPLSVKPSDVDIWVEHWTQVNEIPKMLPPPNEENASVAVSPDITAYSFDRVVVCDSNSIAQFLIANNFHFEQNCAVLSITGYPQSIFSTVLEMLRRNPNLKVYALHDASPRGVSLLHRLGSSPNWFANSNVPIYDLGLLPRHVFASQNMFVRRSHEFAETARQLPEPVRQSLSKDELEWLEMGNYVELEFFSPRRLLQIVTQGIARSRELGSANDMTSVYEDTGYDNTSTSAMIFASESFG